MQEVSQPCFGIDARQHGCAELSHRSLNGFAAAFLKGAWSNKPVKELKVA